MRIAVAGFQHETNTFSPHKTTYDHFDLGGVRPPILRGDEVVSRMRNNPFPIAGAIAAAEDARVETVPLLWAFATPSGAVEQPAFDRLASEIVDRLMSAGRLDGVFLELHGAMVAEQSLDAEGELLGRIRDAIGWEVPVVASLDWHANVTQKMVDAADALVGYRTYPHLDMSATGRRAFDVLRNRVSRGTPFHKAYRQFPFLIPLCFQSDDREVMVEILSFVEKLEREQAISISFFPGFPASDFADCGPSVVCYAQSQALADSACQAIYDKVIAMEASIAMPIYSAKEAVSRAALLSRNASRPIVIADTQDNPGAGGSSDTTGVLRELIAQDVDNAVVGVVYDPAAALKAHEAGVGATVKIRLGGHSGVPGDEPLELDYLVESVSDGQFTCTGVFRSGLRMNLGPSCCLRHKGVRIAVASGQSQLADLEMLRNVGIEPTSASVICAKSSVHFRAAFKPIAHEILLCSAPGFMITDPSDLPWQHLREGVRLRPMGEPMAHPPGGRAKA